MANPGAAVAAGEAIARAGESGKQAAARLYNDAEQQQAKVQAAHAAFAAFTINTRRAKNNALVNSQITQAASEYNSAAEERAKNRIDNYGKPTFDKLPEDMTAIADKVYRKYSAGLDEAQSSMFNSNWTKFVSERAPSIYKEAAKQQVEFSKASLSTSLEQAAQAATKDDFTSFPIYERQVNDILRNAIADGTISALDAVKMQADFKSNVALPNINKMIVLDPDKALFELTNASPADLGLSAEQHGNALVSAQQSAIQKQERDARKKEVEANKEQKKYETMAGLSVETAIQDFKAGRVNDLTPVVAEMLADTRLPEDTKQSLILAIRKTEDQANADGMAVSTIMAKNSKGESLHEFSSGEIDKAYEEMVKTTQPQSLQAEAELVVPFQAPVPMYQKKLESTILGPNDEAGADAVASYERVLKSGNANVLKGMDSQAVAVANYAMDLVKYNQQDPAVAMKQAKETILNMDKETRSILEAEAFNISLEEVDTYMNKAAGGLNSIPIIGMFLPDASIKLTDRLEAERLFRRNYVMQNGNKEAAARLTITQMSQAYGTTKVTKAAAGTIMRYPPEQVNPGMKPEDLRSLIAARVPEGVDIDDVTISNYKMDDLGPNYPKGSKAYMLNRVDEDGVEVPLLDPKTGVQKIVVVPGTGK